MLNDTLNNMSFISWRLVLLVKETGVPGENHRPAASHWQTLSHNVVSSTPRHERDSNSHIWFVMGTDCKSNYHMLTTTTVFLHFDNGRIYNVGHIQDGFKKSKNDTLYFDKKLYIRMFNRCIQFNN